MRIIKKLIASLVIATVGLFAIAVPALAAQISVGNNTTPTASAITDTRSDFAIVDTNHSASSAEHLSSFSYYAANTLPFYFFVVDSGMVVRWVSDQITPSAIGVNTYYPTSSVQVQTGWNVGMYFTSTGTIPFDWGGAGATYTSAGYGVPVIGAPLVPDGTSGRTYYFVAKGFSCEPTGFFRDGINMTAALINPADIVTGMIDATGCNIGVYYNTTQPGIDNANIYGPNYYGVIVQKASVDIKNSDIHDIGEKPFNGMQHGVAVYYANVDGHENGDCTSDEVQTSGTVSDNTISLYQKGGVVVSCPGSNVSVLNNQILGNDKVPYIAQNGIQFGYGAQGEARKNYIDGNWYTGADWTSTGLLLFDVYANQVKTSNNKYINNQTNHSVVTVQACSHMYGGAYGDWGLCMVP